MLDIAESAQRVVVEDVATRASRIVRQLPAIGVKVPNGSRFQLYERDSVQFANVIASRQVSGHKLGAPMFDKVSVAAAETSALDAVLHELGTSPMLPGVKQLLREAIVGPAYPKNDVSDPARDKQAELYAAARLRQAGAIVEFGEPDLVIEVGGEKMGVAVKRPSSMDAIQNRITEGREQVLTSGMAGLVVVDFTVALGANKGVFFLHTLHDAHRLRNHLQSRIARAGARVSEWIRRSPEAGDIYGVVAMYSARFYDQSTGRLGTNFPWIFGPIEPHDKGPIIQALRVRCR